MLAEKLLEAAGNSTQPTYIEDCFSPYLYTGNGSTQSIVNGIDLAGKGGLTWIKIRNTAYVHVLTDTARGVSKYLDSSTTGAQSNTSPYGLTSFNADGFSLKDDSPGNYGVNGNGYTFASWTFRKQPKFFDVVTWTGNGSTTQTISHSLGSVPGCIIAKPTSFANNWWVYHRGTSGTPLQDYTRLNLTNATVNNGADLWGATSTTITVNSSLNLTTNGETYVAYIFAHNAGGFGLTGTDNVISCGSFTTDGSGNAIVNLGYEPQWVTVKRVDAAQDWFTTDSMRGMPWNNYPAGAVATSLSPNTSAAESSVWVGPNSATGFKASISASATYIYIAIRRGPMKVPTDGTKVFSPAVSSASQGTKITTNFPVDMQWLFYRAGGSSVRVDDRLRGVNTTTTAGTISTPYLQTASTSAETSYTGDTLGWDNTGFQMPSGWAGNAMSFNNFQRAPSFFDEVILNSSTSTYTHNLTVAPELIFVKCRDASGANWVVYSKSLSSPTTKYLNLNTTGAEQLYGTGAWSTSATQFSVDTGLWANGSSGVAYLFATCAGVSKVGSYTGNGSSQTINCGFTGGARFVLIKRTDSTGDWYVWDTARGIVSGNDPHLSLNTTSAEVTTDDTIDTDSTGFVVNQLSATNVNVSSATYIYLAIA